MVSSTIARGGGWESQNKSLSVYERHLRGGGRLDDDSGIEYDRQRYGDY